MFHLLKHGGTYSNR